jgi:predicted nucleic acid-binding protein
MILADTTVVIDFLPGPTARSLKIIRDNSAAICGATLAEVYAGARSPADFKRYENSLSSFGLIPTPKKIWPSLGRNLSLLGANGLSVPFPDALIATLAIENDIELWHHDVHFPSIQKILPRLKLFQEPP